MEEATKEYAKELFLILPVWGQVLVAVSGIVVAAFFFLRGQLRDSKEAPMPSNPGDVVQSYKDALEWFKADSAAARLENQELNEKINAMIEENRQLKNEIARLNQTITSLNNELQTIKKHLGELNVQL